MHMLTTARYTLAPPKQVSSRQTPRQSQHSSRLGSHRGGDRDRQRSSRPAYKLNRDYAVSPVQIGSLERDKMLYLAKKLVHLSILLEQVRVHAC